MLTVIKEEFEERVSELLKGQKHYCEVCDDEKTLYLSYVGYDQYSDRYYAVIKCSGCLEVKDYIWSKPSSSEVDGSSYGVVDCSSSSRHRREERGGESR